MRFRLAFSITALCGLLTGCAERVETQEPAGAFSAIARERYRAARDFHDIFSEKKRTLLTGERDYPLGIAPVIGAVADQGDMILVDKLNVRNVFIFGADGSPKGRLGAEGRGGGEYLYPHALFFDTLRRKYYIYDGDLLRLNRYSNDYAFEESVTLPLFIDSFLVTGEGRIFCYAAVDATAKFTGHIIYEVNHRGRIVNRFAPRSATYSHWTSSEQGGLVHIGDYLYLATPYENLIRVYSLDGDEVLRRRFDSPHYVPPGPPPQPKSGEDKQVLLETYHAEWSHVRSILSFDNRMIGIIVAAPKGKRVFLSLFDLDLTPLARDLELPPYLGRSFSKGTSLYLLATERKETEGRLSNPTVVEYRLDRFAPTPDVATLVPYGQRSARGPIQRKPER